MVKQLLTLSVALFLFSCGNKNKEELVDEDQLGIIVADVKSGETNFKEMAKYGKTAPGKSVSFDRSFENAPPLIPHTVEGFLPVKINNNICLSCHMPDKVEKSGAVPISKTHFINLRPQPKLVDGIYTLPPHDSVTFENIDKLNNLYFNCSQCHVAQTSVTVNIENLFSPEFREESGLKKSNLETKIKEGINNNL